MRNELGPMTEYQISHLLKALPKTQSLIFYIGTECHLVFTMSHYIHLSVLFKSSILILR